MTYLVHLRDRTYRVEVDGASVRVNGRALTAALAPIPGTPMVHLLTDAGSRTYAIRKAADGWDVQRAGETWSVEVLDERAARLRSAASPARARSGGVIHAPMPGLVLRVEVAVGDRVSAGNGLIVLEAMKMENEIRAPGAGAVRAVLVSAGEAVEKGAPLIELTADG